MFYDAPSGQARVLGGGFIQRATAKGTTAKGATAKGAIRPLVEAMSGLAARTGFPDREPLLPPLALADMIAGLSGAMATVTALFARANGAVVGTALVDALSGSLDGQGYATAKTVSAVADLAAALAQGVRGARQAAE